MTPEEIAQMTGEAQYRKPQLLKINSLKLNGETGKFVLTHLTEPKGEDGRYVKEEIDGSVELVFLKIRRRLIEASRDGIVRSTSEHNTPNDVVVLFNQKDNTTEKAPAREIRDKYEVLRTEQIVYARFRGQVVRLSVKGASLGSADKSKEKMDFYKYLTSFQEDAHFYEYKTRLDAIEEGETRKYYCINFARGEKLTDEQLGKVYEDIKMVHESCSKFDKYYDVSTVREIKQDIEKESIEGKNDVEYPEEEINPEDIPFN